jgi:hypothetical protein
MFVKISCGSFNSFDTFCSVIVNDDNDDIYLTFDGKFDHINGKFDHINGKLDQDHIHSKRDYINIQQQ